MQRHWPGLQHRVCCRSAYGQCLRVDCHTPHLRPAALDSLRAYLRAADNMRSVLRFLLDSSTQSAHGFPDTTTKNLPPAAPAHRTSHKSTTSLFIIYMAIGFSVTFACILALMVVYHCCRQDVPPPAGAGLMQATCIHAFPTTVTCHCLQAVLVSSDCSWRPPHTNRQT